MNNRTSNFQRVGPNSGLNTVGDFRLTEDFNYNNPVQEDLFGKRKFQLEFDTRRCKPDDIFIKTPGNLLVVHCMYEEEENGLLFSRVLSILSSIRFIK